MNKSNDLKAMVLGQTFETMTPSGRTFVIREQNGHDDELLTNQHRKSDLSNFDDFLLSVLVKEIQINPGNGERKELPVTMDTIENLLINDRTYLLIFSRVKSIGEEIDFEWDWGDNTKTGGKQRYIENLSNYLHDYTKPFPKEGEKGFFKYKIPPYSDNPYGKFEFDTSAGRRFRFENFSRRSEKYILNMDPKEINDLSELKSRNFEMFYTDSQEWMKVENFSMFSKKEMIEISKAIKAVDNVGYGAFSDIENPKDNQVIQYPIMSSPDFFFPTEV